MREQEPYAQTLFDSAADYQWIRELGWSDDDLKSVCVHPEATPADEMINR